MGETLDPRADGLDIEDPEALRRYLAGSGRVSTDAAAQAVITVLAGGVSNRTVKVVFPSGEGWVLKQALARLRVQAEWIADPERINHEAAALATLGRLLPEGAVPRFLFADRRRHLLAMEAVAEPHENWKRMLLDGRLEHGHVRQFASLLVCIHTAGWTHRQDLPEILADRRFFAQLRLEPYYAYAASRQPDAAPFLEGLAARSGSLAQTIVHGDYSPKNVLVHRGRLVLLDHEVMHVGDPAFDLGFSLTHFLAKANHLRSLRDDFAAAAALCWQVYADATEGLPWMGGMEERVVEHTLACLLARVIGRSPLEYLSEPEKGAQRRAAGDLILRRPATVTELVERFITGLHA